jgi:abhydrolase domain-containing protein 6
MKNIIKFIVITIPIIVALGAIIFFFFPEKIIQLTNWNFTNQAGLQKKTILVNNYTVNYYQSKVMDKEKTLVLLHGMGDDKSSFLQSAKLLAKKYNLILPDLNGHGENEKNKSSDYSIKGQTFFLHEFLKSIKITSYYLGGNSMGGHTSLAYTLHYPNEVKALILINAPGVSLDEHIVYGGFGKPIEDQAGLNKVLARVFFKVPDIPSPIANYMIETVNGSLDFVDNTLVPSITKGEDFDLKNLVANIDVPTFILWGKHDTVVKMNVAEYFNKTISNSKLSLIENASHSPQLELPDEVANKIIEFIDNAKIP